MNHERRLEEFFRTAQIKYRHLPFFRSLFINLSKYARITFTRSERVKTACIFPLSSSYVIEINSVFFSRYIKTPEDLLFLLSHEILHLLVGHFADGKHLLFRYPRKIANFAMDMVINQLIYTMMREYCMDYENLFVYDFYSVKRECPYVLLLPLQEWLSHVSLSGYMCNQVISFLEADPLGQLDRVASHVYMHFSKESPDVFQDIGECSEDRLPDSLSSRLKKIMGTLWSELVQSVFYGDDDFSHASTELLRRSRLKTEIVQAVLEMVSEEKARTMEARRGAGVLPYYSRYDCFLASAGYTPLIYHKNLIYQLDGKGVVIYVDVSASQFKDLPHVMGALLSLREYIAFPLYAFSTKVFPLSLKDLGKGFFRTTLGTNFDPVAAHILHKHVRKAVLITDGFAQMSPYFIEKIRRNCLILTILVGAYSRSGMVEKFSWRILRWKERRKV